MKKASERTQKNYDEKAKSLSAAQIFLKQAHSRAIGTLQPKRDLSRFIRWPKNIRIQRQKAVLMRTIKMPPQLNQFNKTMSKSLATDFLTLASKYKPESDKEKKSRLAKDANSKANDGKSSEKKPLCLKKGVNCVTSLIESKRAKLVIIAHDVDPIEIVVWMPALCRKLGIPYAIIKGKARLGALVGMKTASCVAFTAVRPEDEAALKRVVQSCNDLFSSQWHEDHKRWGGVCKQNEIA